jgi:hypothetical protein
MQNSIYKARKHVNDNLNFLGYDYKKGDIMKNSVSDIIYKTPSLKNLLITIENVLLNLIYATKSIKKSTNWCVSQDSDDIN